MSVLPLILAVVVGARYLASDPLTANGSKPVPVAEGVSGEIVYTPRHLFFIFRGPGKPEGRFIVQVRPGMRNCAFPVAPFAYEVENAVGGAVTDLLPVTAHTRQTPRFPPDVETRVAADGWVTYVAFPFYGRLACWPIPDGAKRPGNWYATVRHVAADGKAVDWGTPGDPLQIVWGKSATFKAARDGLFAERNLVEAYRDMRAKYCDLYDFSQKEKWIGYLNPGIETFAWRQADSEKLFYDAHAAAIAAEYDEALKLLEYGEDKEYHVRRIPPKSLTLADPAKERLFRMIDGFNYASDRFTAARLQYLRDRFMGRPVTAAQPVKPKKPASEASKLKAPDASVEEGTISLDDDELQF